MSRYKVVVTDWDFADLEVERQVLSAVGAELVPHRCRTEDELIAACQGADALLNQYAKLTRRVLEQLPGCRAIVRYGVGVDTVDLPAATELGIQVANVPDYGVDEVATHAIGLMLASARRIARYDREIRAGRWDHTLGRPIYRLAGQTLGLAGFGRIARAVGAKAQGIGLHVIAYDPYMPPEAFGGTGVERVGSLNDLLPRADFLSLHVPLTAETRHLVSFEQFRLMKPGAHLVNTGRGPLVDEEALLDALATGKIAGAALDVMEREPAPPDHPLLQQPNLVVTPHAAFYSEQALVDLQRKAAEDVARALQGEPLRNLVNTNVVRRGAR